MTLPEELTESVTLLEEVTLGLDAAMLAADVVGVVVAEVVVTGELVWANTGTKL